MTHLVLPFPARSLSLAFVVVAMPAATAQVLLNEANAVSADEFLAVDFDKPYEGFDFGRLPYSGNRNAPNAADPGNPFPADINGGAPGFQTDLPNGWSGVVGEETGWARVEGNGGDWMELLITTDNTDLRGWTLYWENDETDANGNDVTTGLAPGNLAAGEHPEERGFIKFSQNDAWSDLRAGTLITISEQNSVIERRDAYPSGPVLTGLNSTGHVYDLSTDTCFSPKDGDWHQHFFLDESQTDEGIATEYFEAFSDIKVDNDNWRMAFFDPSNTALAGQVEDEALGRGDLDLTTGLIGEFIGESGQPEGPDGTGYGSGANDDFGSDIGGGGLGNDEAMAFYGNTGFFVEADGTGVNERYEDVDFSTFGTANLFNDGDETTLGGVQDLSALRAWLDSIPDGDANLDGAVDLLDLDILGSNWQAEPALWKDGDFNGDGKVDLLDLDILGANWGTGTSFAEALASAGFAIPEPAGVTFIALLGLGMKRRRR